MIPIQWRSQSVRVGRQIGDETFSLCVLRGSIFSVEIPYSLVEQAWRNGPYLALRLRGRLVLRPGGIVFEPEAG